MSSPRDRLSLKKKKEKKTFSRCSVLSKVCWFKIVLIIKTFVIMNGLWICGKVLTGSKLNRPWIKRHVGLTGYLEPAIESLNTIMA